MKFYLVGGCVRDRLLGLPVRDRDWVVVGGSPRQMLDLGYLPVGKDFPVFLHPTSHEEYALARTERKTGRGYAGFAFHAAPDVTLEEDLARRDLTINAMAQDPGDGDRITDPFGGQRDLQARLLRHVGPHFVEDPVRILRVARLAARLTDFTVAAETRALLRAMVVDREADALVPERVWREIAQGLMGSRPSRMLQVLADCGLMQRLYAELQGLKRVEALLDRAADAGLTLAARFAVLASACGTPARLTDLLAKLRVDAESAQIAALLLALRSRLDQSETPDAVIDVLERADAVRRPERFETLLQAAQVLDCRGLERLRTALRAARAVDAGAIAAATAASSATTSAATSGPTTATAPAGQANAIRDAVRAARVAAIERALAPA
jgi:tRNA nucleotidyltransferase (CCA-adding enzyme)